MPQYPASKPGLAATAIGCALALSLFASCAPPKDGLAFLDPVMAALDPAAASMYRKAAGRLQLLPAEGSQAALYAALDELDPEWVILSPIMAPELEKLRTSRPDTALLFCGPYAVESGHGIYSSVFMDTDAAVIAARFLARRPDEGGLCLGLFSGRGAQAEADAFIAAWEESGKAGQAITRLLPEGYSEETARELRSLDISSAFVLAPAKEASRWAQTAFEESAFVVLAAPFGLEAEDAGADALVAWDIEKALSELVRRYLTAKKTAAGPDSREIEPKSADSAPWKIVLSR